MLKGFTIEYRGLIYYTEETVKWSTWEKYYEKSKSLCCVQKCGVYKLYIESLKNLCVPPKFFPYSLGIKKYSEQRKYVERKSFWFSAFWKKSSNYVLSNASFIRHLWK